jgi:hypothetical protein
MEPEQIGYWIGVLFGGFVVGALFGLFPLLVGLKKNLTGLAIAGWITSVCSGLVMGIILALPVSLIFGVTLLVMKRTDGPN